MVSDDRSSRTVIQPSRRSLIAAALGGVGATLASAFASRVPGARAAAGDPFVIGASNDAGSSQSIILSTAGGAAFTLKDSQTSGTGVFGWSSATAGTGRGLYGRSDSPDGFGIQAKNTALTPGTGAAIEAVGGQSYGLKATGDHIYRPAVSGHHNGAGIGVSGYSPDGLGVTGTSTTNNGVYGLSSTSAGVRGLSGSGYGVQGQSSSNYGVWGSSTSNTGVYGRSDSGIGVYAIALGSSPAVFGTSADGIAIQGTSTNNWSGYFGIDARVENDFQVGGNQSVGGYLAVTGTLSKGGGSFKIDHPLDPARKYLSHSFVESPDMLNIYNGIATLDPKGQAAVQMPAWFDALNRDFRYQLTALDGAAPDLHVSARLTNGRFAIAGGAPGQEVSWQVTGIRHDRYANANRIQVEETKVGKEAGTYLHPELYGQPRSKAIPPKYPRPKPQNELVG